MLAANNIPLLEPNVLYLEDKPPKTVTFKKAAKIKKSAVKKKNIAKTKKAKTQTKKSKLAADITVKIETELESDKTENLLYSNDPLYTPEILIKCEIDENKIEQEQEEEEDRLMLEDLEQKQYEMQKDEDYNFDSDMEQYEKDEFYNIEEEEIDDDYADEDEPLILLGETRKKYKVPRFQRCLDTCKFKCVAKFSHDQRRDIYDYYRNLSQDVKLQFIRKHIKKCISRIRNRKRDNYCCYFLKCYKHNDMVSWTNSNDDDDNLKKVCRKFFKGTLGNVNIKKAIDGYELEQVKLVRPIAKIEDNKSHESPMVKPQKPQLFLDPETGNLTDSKPKTKTIRRKRGEPERERFPRPINCAIRCTFKCHQNFNEQERKQICDIFWSLDFKRRKDFILAHIETKDVETPSTPEFRKTNRPTRAFQTRFFLRSGLHGENKRVCKHFMMSTLCINRMVIENAIKYADKTTGNYTGVDGRGKNFIHKINLEGKQGILDHINSYPTWRPNIKTKLRCLHHTLSIKKMYEEYKEKCEAEELKPVSAFYYYKVFHEEFRLQFLNPTDPKKIRKVSKTNPNISQYNGEEPGGCWMDFKGNPLDVSYINPGESLNNIDMMAAQHLYLPPSSMMASTSLHLQQTTAAATQHLTNFIDLTAAEATT